MHILVIPSWYQTPFNRLNGVFFKDQALAVAEKVNQVGIVAPVLISIKEVFKTRLLSFKEERYSNNGVTEYIQPILAFPFWKRFNRSLQYHIGKKMLKQYILENGMPDLVHLQSALAGKLAMWLQKEYQIPFVVTEHSSAFQRQKLKNFELKSAQEVFNSSKVNIAVSDSLAKDLKSLFKQEFVVIPNIVDTDFFTPSIQKNDKFTFLNVAHLNKNKNHKLLIKSFKELLKKEDAKLVIAGSGDERKNLEHLIASLGLEKKVILYGKANRKEVRLLMQQANCFVLSSRVETFGVVLIEAMASGIPIISTKCGGPESIVNEQVGKLTNQNVKELSDAMKKMLNSSYSLDVILKYSQQYSKSTVAEKIIDSYRLCTE